MTLDKDTLLELQKAAAIEQANKHIGPPLVVALPNDFTAVDLEKYAETRRRMRGTMTTLSVQHFAEFVKLRYSSGAAVFIDADAMKATAVLNLGEHDTPGHADFRAIYEPRKTAPFKALKHLLQQAALTQQMVAEFLEDWEPHILAYNDKGESITVPQATAAVRRITIEALAKRESTVESLSESRSTFDQVKATSADPLPAFIHFTCEPYGDIERRTFVLRLGIFPDDKRPRLTLRAIKMEEHEERMAAELAERVRERVTDENDDIAVIVGTYNAH